jgi:hypothetical protein
LFFFFLQPQRPVPQAQLHLLPPRQLQLPCMDAPLEQPQLYRETWHTISGASMTSTLRTWRGPSRHQWTSRRQCWCSAWCTHAILTCTVAACCPISTSPGRTLCTPVFRSCGTCCPRTWDKDNSSVSRKVRPLRDALCSLTHVLQVCFKINPLPKNLYTLFFFFKVFASNSWTAICWRVTLSLETNL